ncbi:hypothetical protein Hanom_Chr12g01157221 [Helianthus anomalus]
MGDPHDFVDDLVAYSPNRVFRNNFICDGSPAVHFQQGSSSLGLGHVRDENIQPEVDLQQSHFQMFSPNEEDMWSDEYDEESPLAHELMTEGNPC